MDTKAAPRSTNPEAELAEQQKALKETQDAIAKLTRSASGTEATIAALQAKIASVQQALAGYDTRSKAMTKQLNEYQDKISQKTRIAETVLKDDKDKLDRKIQQFQDGLDAQLATLETACAEAGEAAAAAAEANAQATQKQFEFEAKKKSAGDVQALLDGVASLLDQANKAETQGEYVTLYGLAKIARTLIDTIKVDDTDTLTQALRTLQDDAEAARDNATGLRQDAMSAAAHVAAEKAAYEAAQAGRTANLLKALNTPEP